MEQATLFIQFFILPVRIVMVQGENPKSKENVQYVKDVVTLVKYPQDTEIHSLNDADIVTALEQSSKQTNTLSEIYIQLVKTLH